MTEKLEAKPAEPKETDAKPKPKRKCCLFCGLIVVVLIIFSVVSRLIYLSYYNENQDNDKNINIPARTVTEVASESKPKNTAPSKKSTNNTETESAQEAPVSEPEKASESQPNTMLEYFIDTAVYDYQKREFFITRWNKSDVSVGVAEGSFTDSLNGCLSGFISDFNAQSSSAKLRRDDTVDLGIPNIKIYYWEDAQFKERAGQSATYGVTEWIHKDDKSLQRSMMFLSHELMNADEAIRCQVIRHEMMHAVGFWGHSNQYFEGIMSTPKTRYIYPEEDKRLVRMLYSSGIPIGLNAGATRDYLNNNPGW